MGKLNKILISIIVLLIIILAIVTYSYFRVKKVAQDNLNNFLEATNQIHELEKECDSLQK